MYNNLVSGFVVGMFIICVSAIVNVVKDVKEKRIKKILDKTKLI